MGLLNKFAFPALCLATVAGSAAAVLTFDRWIAPSDVASETEDAARARTANIALRGDRDMDSLRAEAPFVEPVDEPANDEPFELAAADDSSPPTSVGGNGPLGGVFDEPAAPPESLDDWTTETHSEAAASLPGPRLLRGPTEAIRKRPAAAAPASGPPLPPQFTLKERLAAISPTASRRLVAKFLAAGASFPPADIGLVAIKDQKVIELHARASGGEWKLVHQYKVLAASGGAGPKLAQGDRQVPEGVYGISFLNPNSRYHVALRVNYPNDFDRRMAENDGRKNLGGDIMIHGKAASIGCLAIGDAAAEELFVLADMTGLANIKLVIAPTDFRRYGVPDADPAKPKWTPQLYTQVASAMTDFKAPPSVGLLSFFGKW